MNNLIVQKQPAPLEAYTQFTPDKVRPATGLPHIRGSLALHYDILGRSRVRLGLDLKGSREKKTRDTNKVQKQQQEVSSGHTPKLEL